jgi:uncharacterized protein (DUF2141 family)
MWGEWRQLLPFFPTNWLKSVLQTTSVAKNTLSIFIQETQMKVAFSVILLSLLPQVVYSFDLTVNITNIKEKQGSLRVAVYNSVKGFPENEPRLAARVLKLTNTDLNVSFKDLSAGRYAVAVMQDQNDNGVLDRNFFGIPSEPYGFSQQPSGKSGQPTFNQAAFELNANKEITVKLIH